MHPKHEQPNTAPEQSALEEREPRLQPRIYVASLSDYNAGRLHGTWLDATGDTEQLATGINDMLARSPEPGAEEWAIHDYEGFGPLRLSEYESIDTIARIAGGIAAHGPAFAHWAAIAGTATDDLDSFDDAYLGHAESIEAYAEALVDDLGYTDLIDRAIPEHLQPYVRFDIEGFSRDLELSGDVTTSEGDGGVYLFSHI
jgi:antirestriction protein